MTEKMRDGIIKRGRTYSYVVRERDPETGKTKPRWVGGFTTRASAKAARDEARHAVHSGTYVAPQQLTVGAWLDRWLEGHVVELKPSTAANYRSQCDRYLKPAIGHERLQQLSPSRLSAVWRELHERGGRGGKPVSQRTVELARAVLRKALHDAVVERVIPVNPVTGSKLPKRQGKAQHTTWTGAQVATFLEHAVDDRWLPLWTLATATGMRRGELMALTWEHLDLDAALVAVERSTTQVDGELVTTTPKNHERRKVAIDPRTVATMRAWRKAQAEELLALGLRSGPSTQVFTWPDGARVQPDYVTKVWPRVQATVGAKLKAAELPALPRLTVHETRHTHATMLLRAGVPVHIVAKRLGHKDPSVTLNVYADVIPDDDTSAVDTYSKAVWGPRSLSPGHVLLEPAMVEPNRSGPSIPGGLLQREDHQSSVIDASHWGEAVSDII